MTDRRVIEDYTGAGGRQILNAAPADAVVEIS